MLYIYVMFNIQVSLSCENKTDSRTIWKGAERLQIIYSPIAKGEDNFQLHVDPVYDKGKINIHLHACEIPLHG